jgi:exopolysaccharide biosynthesis predicted pyruvyltransferase EpsI
MHESLNHVHHSTHEAVVYDNWQFPWKKADPTLPRLKNNRRFRSSAAKWAAIDETMKFLSSGQVVLTSAYHGMVWATLAGVPVVVTREFSSKFASWPYQTRDLLPKEDWQAGA